MIIVSYVTVSMFAVIKRCFYCFTLFRFCENLGTELTSLIDDVSHYIQSPTMTSHPATPTLSSYRSKVSPQGKVAVSFKKVASAGYCSICPSPLCTALGGREGGRGRPAVHVCGG